MSITNQKEYSFVIPDFLSEEDIEKLKKTEGQQNFSVSGETLAKLVNLLPEGMCSLGHLSTLIKLIEHKNAIPNPSNGGRVVDNKE